MTYSCSGSVTWRRKRFCRIIKRNQIQFDACTQLVKHCYLLSLRIIYLKCVNIIVISRIVNKISDTNLHETFHIVP